MITYFSTMAQIIPVLFLVVVVEYRQFGQKDPPRGAVARVIKSIYLVIIGIVIFVFGTAAEWVALTASFVLGVKDETPENMLPAANFCFVVVIAMSASVVLVAFTQVLSTTSTAPSAPPASPAPATYALEGDSAEKRVGIGAAAAVSVAAATAIIVSLAARRNR